MRGTGEQHHLVDAVVDVELDVDVAAVVDADADVDVEEEEEEEEEGGEAGKREDEECSQKPEPQSSDMGVFQSLWQYLQKKTK